MEGTEPGTIIGQAPDVGSTMEPNGSMLVEITIEPQHPDGGRGPCSNPAAVVVRGRPHWRRWASATRSWRSLIPMNQSGPAGWSGRRNPAPGTVVEAGAVVILRVAP
ncbi:MAG: hypothetical protein Ct9H300mP12_00810 [Acidimicrobiales bacterium]|nr:MAG: hypothetical protein Ct9H300mP12_00810 [Acidimicrobiales bacterium]